MCADAEEGQERRGSGRGRRLSSSMSHSRTGRCREWTENVLCSIIPLKHPPSKTTMSTFHCTGADRCVVDGKHLFPQVHKVTGHHFPPPIPKYCKLPYLNKRTQPQPPQKKKELCHRAKTLNGKNKRKQQRFMRGVKEKHKFFPGSNQSS